VIWTDVMQSRCDLRPAAFAIALGYIASGGRTGGDRRPIVSYGTAAGKFHHGFVEASMRRSPTVWVFHRPMFVGHVFHASLSGPAR